MNSVAYLDTARGWARTLEEREARRSGVDLEGARPIVARRTGVPKGTLVSLRKNRLKGIAVHWYERLRAAVIHELEDELRHVQHELQIARQVGADPHSSEVFSALESEKRLREALGLDVAAPSSDGEGG